jgi:hypothetical protein
MCFSAGQSQAAYDLREHLLTLAQQAQDPILLLQAHQALGGTLYYRGEPVVARSHSVIRVVRVILTHTLTRQVYRDSRRPRRIFLCDFYCGFYTIGPIGLSA